jgi:hypothetical protein
VDSVSYNLGRPIGPLISIALVYWISYAWAFVGNAISFVLFTIILWMVARGSGRAGTKLTGTGRLRIASRDGRIMILLLMVAVGIVADDPVLVLGPTLARGMHVPADSSGWFIAAPSAGCVMGSVRRPRHLPSLRLAATALALLGMSMVIFVLTPWMWLSVAAASSAGLAGLIANSATRTLLDKYAGPDRIASVMAMWAIAWAGSKPMASLVDGLLAGSVGARGPGSSTRSRLDADCRPPPSARARANAGGLRWRHGEPKSLSSGACTRRCSAKGATVACFIHTALWRTGQMTAKVA